MSSTVATPRDPASALELRQEGHPPGLYVLFTTEMWERFSFYGLRALLVLYLSDLTANGIGLKRSDALNIYAIYTGLIYLTPLIGGRLADRYLGQRKAVFIGGILMALGQFALTQKELLNLGLGLLIIGNGFFKPNISTMVGALYPQGDHRRDGAYTIFYMGINLGAFLSPLVCGPLGERVGWGYGFATAGIGMILGLLTFVFTQRLLMGTGLPPGREVTPQASLGPRDTIEIVAIAAGVAVAVFAATRSWPWLQPFWSPAWLTNAAASILYRGAILIAGLVLFLYLTEPANTGAQTDSAREPFTAQDWQRIAVIIIISLFSILFWMGFEQSGGTLNLFAKEQTDRTIFGYDVPASVFQAVNPVFIILLAPVFAALWTYLARHRFPLPSMGKQGIGLALLGVAFVLMYFASERAKTGQVSWLWLIAVYFIFTVAELFVSPIGLSLVNKLAPARVASLMMACWFLCTAAANYLAGIMEKTLEPFHWNLWVFLSITAIVPGLLLLALTPLLVKMSHGRV
jgi:POT family proton-dependent oligopeptide transporter